MSLQAAVLSCERANTLEHYCNIMRPVLEFYERRSVAAPVRTFPEAIVALTSAAKSLSEMNWKGNLYARTVPCAAALSHMIELTFAQS